MERKIPGLSGQPKKEECREEQLQREEKLFDICGIRSVVLVGMINKVVGNYLKVTLSISCLIDVL